MFEPGTDRMRELSGIYPERIKELETIFSGRTNIYDVETISYLNTRLRNLNKPGILYFEDRKCNFDVEIERDMLLDFAKGEADHFVLWSGDSDFADPIRQLLSDGKTVVLSVTARKVSSELNELRGAGLRIFDIQKIRDFICWPREMKAIKSKKDPIS